MAERCNDRSNETVADSVKQESIRRKRHETLPCGSDDNQNYEGIYKLPQRETEALDQLWLREFRGVGLRRRILHDIWETPSDGLGRRFKREIISPLFGRYNGMGEAESGARRNGRNGIFIVAEHEEHLHIIHDCAYSGSTCRCVHVQRLRDYTTEEVESQSRTWENDYVPEGEITITEAEDIERERYRRRISTGDALHGQSSKCRGRERAGCGYSTKETEEECEVSSAGESDRRRGDRGNNNRRGLRLYARKSCASSFLSFKYWQNCAKYFIKGRRRLYQYNVAGRAWVHAYEIRAVPVQRLREIAQEPVLDEENIQFLNSDLWAGLSCVQDADDTKNADNQRHHEIKRCQNREKKSNRMEKWLESFIITPMKNILYTGHWINGPYRYVPKNKQLLTTCFHNIQQKIVDMTYRELFLKTRIISMNKLIYVAPWNAVSEYYYDIIDSIAVLEDLLKHQFDSNKYDIYNFLKNLYYLVDKKVPKKNCVCIVGPSCSGKNFFFDCFIHSCINFGQIGNFNKYDRFPLQDALQRRILLWNEPNFEPGSEEILKLLFGGDTCAARIKYEGDACILRTPIVVLTNRDVIPNETTFTSRVWKYHWNVAPFLKYLTKKPHPLSMFYLFLKHNILSKNNYKFESWEVNILKQQ